MWFQEGDLYAQNIIVFIRGWIEPVKKVSFFLPVYFVCASKVTFVISN